MLVAKVIAGLLAGTRLRRRRRGRSDSRSGTLILSARGITFALDGSQMALLLLGTLAAVALWGAIGVGLGAIVRSQVGAIIGLLAWGFVVENLLFAFVPSVGRFGPVHAQDSSMGFTSGHHLPTAAGIAVLVGWAVLFSVVGILVGARRDVN